MHDAQIIITHNLNSFLWVGTLEGRRGSETKACIDSLASTYMHDKLNQYTMCI